MPRRTMAAATQVGFDDSPPPAPPPTTDNVLEEFSFYGQAVNARQVAIALPNDQNGVVTQLGNAEHWYIRSSSLRGGWRHTCALEVYRRLTAINPNYRITTATARLLSLGGVKSSGTSKVITPRLIDRAKTMNPLVEMFGCNEPAFFAGALYPSHMVSDNPIDRDRSNSRAYHLQVVRRPLSHGPFTADNLLDPETIEEFSEVNRYRSKLDGLAKLISTRERQLTNKPDPKLKKQLDVAYEELEKLTDRKFTSATEVKEFFESELTSIRSRGHSTVSEQTIPLGQEVIPSGTPMTHSLHIVGARRMACGLLVDGISTKNFRRPYVGGRAAQGAGGYLTSQYTVYRLVNNEKVYDCTLKLTPEKHIEWHDSEGSVLRDCYKEWLDADITKFDFTFEGLRNLASGNNGATEESPC